MNNLSILDDVVRQLELDPNIIRIKKLIFFTCYGSWESNINTLNSISTRDLLLNLLNLNLSLEELTTVLNNIANKLNKSTEYAFIAKQIVSQISRFYAPEEDLTKPLTAANADDATQPEISLIHQQLPQPSNPVLAPKLPEADEWWDLKIKIIQQTTPMRAKIVIFSALYHEFTYSEKDWSIIKKQDLDDLLRNLFYTCATPTELEEKLTKAAKKLDNPSESIQSATAIVKYLRPCYGASDTVSEAVSSPVFWQPASEESSPSDAAMILNNHANGSSSELGNTSFIEPTRSGNSTPQTDQELPSEPNGAAFAPAPEVQHISPPSPEPTAEPEPDTAASDGSYSTGSKAIAGNFNIAAALKQTRGLEADIKAIVSDRVNGVMNFMEDTLTELEKVLERRLRGESVNRRIYLKYKFLKELIAEVQKNADKYMDVLSQMEADDLQDLKPAAPAEPTPAVPSIPLEEPPTKPGELSPEPPTKPGDMRTEPPTKPGEQGEIRAAETPVKSPDIDGEQRAKVLELAHQGSPKAIAALMNQYLKTKGITALAIVKEDCLHIILESEQEPHPDKIVHFVRKHILELQLTSFESVKAHWRKLGNKSPSWSKKIELIPEPDLSANPL
ncbi:MAG TPA: hypothetical protein IGS52_14390 [Oscillatoriaceae cyanobacterium M33_DOE_052]|uniref:Uncharacterized protein n=1 Tax=Planktothricoides sp. SpSt-374 TaxID=2282167 RepID=A0A7C3ZVF4_9CYAN|nr:hypothetical protein [Oscillatoriaceae cyanobacterium M33_DOE_052]